MDRDRVRQKREKLGGKQARERERKRGRERERGENKRRVKIREI